MACHIAVDACPCRHGLCVDGGDGPTCECNAGWKGVMCDRVHLATSGCSHQGMCSGHGVCATNTTTNRALYGAAQLATGKCVCNPGSGQSNCALTVESMCNLTCSGWGRCDDLAAECSCRAGFTGDDCSIAPCPVDSGKVCGGHGVCDAVANNQTHQVSRSCTCDPGWTAEACHEVAPRSCPNACSDHGVCKVDTVECDCFEDYAGADCSQYVGTVPDESPDASEF